MALTTIECNECGAKSIYSDKEKCTVMVCKACKSDDTRIINNPWEIDRPWQRDTFPPSDH